MNAIPTMYAGVQFRSRLEARWAAFFDLLDWKWEYEPIDLNGYIPDFLVTPPMDEPLLVEVKPLVMWPCGIKGCDCGEADADARRGGMGDGPPYLAPSVQPVCSTVADQ